MFDALKQDELLFARAAGEAERLRGKPVQLALSLEQLMLLGGLCAVACGGDEAPASMRMEGVRLIQGMANELAVLGMTGAAGLLRAVLPEGEGIP